MGKVPHHSTYQGKQRLKVTLCGSTRFKPYFEECRALLGLEGYLVYSVSFYGHYDKVYVSPDEKKELDYLHLDKIRDSDIIVVVDPLNYIGESTKNEIDYALSLNKEVRYMSVIYPHLVNLDVNSLRFYRA